MSITGKPTNRDSNKKTSCGPCKICHCNAYKSINLHARGRIFSLVGRIVYTNDLEVSMYMYFGFFVPQNHCDLPAPGPIMHQLQTWTGDYFHLINVLHESRSL